MDKSYKDKAEEIVDNLIKKENKSPSEKERFGLILSVYMILSMNRRKLLSVAEKTEVLSFIEELPDKDELFLEFIKNCITEIKEDVDYIYIDDKLHINRQILPKLIKHHIKTRKYNFILKINKQVKIGCKRPRCIVIDPELLPYDVNISLLKNNPKYHGKRNLS